MDRIIFYYYSNLSEEVFYGMPKYISFLKAENDDFSLSFSMLSLSFYVISVKKLLIFGEIALNYWTLNTSFNTMKTQYIFYSLKVLMGG